METNQQNNFQIGFESRNILSRLSRQFFLKKRQEKVLDEDKVEERNELLKSIKDIHSEWVNANKNFEFAWDQASVDYYTYSIKACEIRYEYFLKKAKEEGIDVGKILFL